MNKHDLSIEGVRAAPPVAVAGLTVAGVTLHDIVLIATLIYLIINIAFVIYKWAKHK